MVKRPSPLDIYKLLDKSNCGACGARTCMEFATDLLERRKTLDACPPEHLPDKKRKKLEKLLTPPQLPLRFGVGERACTIGGEEAFFRHDLTFFNETALVQDVYDEQPDLMERVKYIDNFVFSRIGDDLKFNGIAIRCTSGDPDKFAETVKKVADSVTLPLVLVTWDPKCMEKAAEAIADKKPLLYAANRQNWKEMGAIAVKNNLPLVCFSQDLDELASLVKTLENMGVKEMALDPGAPSGPGFIRETVNRVMKIRLASIRDGDQLIKYPVIGVPASIWAYSKFKKEDEKFAIQFREALIGVTLMSMDINMLIMHTGSIREEIWVPMALMTLRQNIFTDPRIYPRVDPGLYKIGNPDENSPIFVTSNYRMTKIPVEQDIADAHIDAWLLVVDTDGLGIEAGVAGGQLSADKIAEAVKEYKVFEKVNHRVLVIPGLAARLQGALEDEANCYVVVGPKDSSGIQRFMEETWNLEKFMKEYRERIS